MTTAQQPSPSPEPAAGTAGTEASTLRTPEQLAASIAVTTAALQSNILAIESAVNVPKRMRRTVARTKARVRGLRRDEPLIFGAAVLGAAAATGGLVYLCVRAIVGRSS